MALGRLPPAGGGAADRPGLGMGLPTAVAAFVADLGARLAKAALHFQKPSYLTHSWRISTLSLMKI